MSPQRRWGVYHKLNSKWDDPFIFNIEEEIGHISYRPEISQEIRETIPYCRLSEYKESSWSITIVLVKKVSFVVTPTYD